MEKEKPIGVFDSGVGGLTVVKRLISALPNENIVYFGDTARVPYGSKSNETVIEYSNQNTKFLLKKNVKAVVVACNTASSIALDVLKKEFDIPIFGMIDPGANYAAKSTVNKKIGVIGTRATINNHSYKNELHKINKELIVFEKACPLFVPLAEEGWIEHKATYQIAKEYLQELRDKEIDTLILGCTHYPILSKPIQSVVGENVKLIDSGLASSEVVRNEIQRIGLLTNSSAKGNISIYLSDISTNFKSIAELFLGQVVDQIIKVDLENLLK